MGGFCFVLLDDSENTAMYHFINECHLCECPLSEKIMHREVNLNFHYNARSMKCVWCFVEIKKVKNTRSTLGQCNCFTRKGIMVKVDSDPNFASHTDFWL